MIDLTPLDVRKKKGDFRRGLRGYDPLMVDEFLDLVAERLEELVRENATLRERADQLQDSMDVFREREQALNEALVSAQQLREEVRQQASREAEVAMREARAQAERLVEEARHQVTSAADSVRRVHQQRVRYVRAFRAFVERANSELELEEERLREVLRGDHEPTAAAPPAPPPPAEDS